MCGKLCDKPSDYKIFPMCDTCDEAAHRERDLEYNQQVMKAHWQYEESKHNR